MQKTCIFLLVTLMGLNIFAIETTFGPFQLMNDGSIKFGQATASIIHFGKQWKTAAVQSVKSVTANPGYPKMESGCWTLQGKFTTPSGIFVLEERVTWTGDDKIALEISLKSDKPVTTAELALLLSFPVVQFTGQVITIDSQEIILPAVFKTSSLSERRPYTKLTLRSDRKWNITGGSSVLFQDDRKYKSPYYSARIGFNPSSGELNAATLKLEIHAEPYETKPLDISSAANFGFTDQVAGDSRGGWTDQGPENDLHMFKSGSQTLGGVKFEIINEKANQGKACLVLGDKHLPHLPASAIIPANGKKINYLCLLHALAWAPEGNAVIGHVNVEYVDGRRKSFPIVNAEDVGNWWYPMALSKAQVAWQAENKSAYVGLYLSVLPLGDSPVSKIEFVSKKTCIWMIAGLSAATELPPKRVDQPIYTTESADWKPLNVCRETLPDSALDFSFLNDAPAGKYGRVIIRNGKFTFEQTPKRPIRFYGVNLYFEACFPDREHAEKLANMLVRRGYNSVRFHHFDHLLPSADDPTRTRLDLERMKRLDYLFKCLKDRGIYVTLDLYTCRGLPDNGRILGIQDGKVHILLRQAMMKNLKEFSRNLLCHVNPYTGMAWKDDPALAFISLINEDALFFLAATPEAAKLFNESYTAWQKTSEGKQLSGESPTMQKYRFICNVQHRAYSELAEFLRSIGVKTPFTDHNSAPETAFTPIRKEYDYVDNHTYWAHPTFVGKKRWKLPMLVIAKSAVSQNADVPAQIFPTRIFGKPFTVTEFNYSFPNPNRAEGGALMGAYAALQDWDAVYRFGFAGKIEQLDREVKADLFDGVDEPMQSLSDRIAVLLFRRGDVRASSNRIAFAVEVNPSLFSPAGSLKMYPDICNKLGLIDQVGSIVGNKGTASLPDGIRLSFPVNDMPSAQAIMTRLKQAYGSNPGQLDLKQNVFRSSTGEIELNGDKGLFKVVAPRSEVVVMLGEGSIKGNQLRVVNRKDFTCIAVSSLDNHSLADSRRILLFHLTNTTNTMIKFSDPQKNIVESWGRLPQLARRGIAALTLKLSPGAQPEVYALDLGGKRLGKINTNFSPTGVLTFTADTFTFKQPCFVYEIVR